MKDSPKNPKALDIARLCRDGAQWSGHWPVAQMTRLAESLEAATDAAVAWQAQAWQHQPAGGAPELWLHLQGQARLPLQCQRCLLAVEQDLQVDRRFRFVRTEAEAERLDEELEDDVMVLPVRLNLPDLLEDELILALPLVPRHEPACEQPLPVPLLASPPDEPGLPAPPGAAAADAVPPGSAARERPANPFAALAALRGKLDADKA